MQKLSVEEKKELQRLEDEGYLYITRNSAQELWAYNKKPEKGTSSWCKWWYRFDEIVNNQLFKFIKWEDNEPHEIEKLLEGKE